MYSLIFDIGKTNKKYFVFDRDFNVIESNKSVFDEIVDEDGFPCDDIALIRAWMINIFETITDKYTISSVNFSTHGASLVHLDEEGEVVGPLYNYLKPLPRETEALFIKKLGDKTTFQLETSSPLSGMLNSGIQLFWLKNKLAEQYKKIATSLHYPQYGCFLLTGEKYSEYTSIGSHTGLWDYNRNRYHNWVKEEEIDSKFPSIVDSTHRIKKNNMVFGVGIHDSSAALVPYLKGTDEKFILISTGTWSIVLNPFNSEPLTINELEQDCLQFMQPDGKPVKASRLFLGKELSIQTKILSDYFVKSPDYFMQLKLDLQMYKRLSGEKKVAFHFDALNDDDIRNTELSSFESYEEAYHQLMIEIVDRQIKSLKLAIGRTKNIESIYIDGGFTNNDLFCKILAHKLPQFQFKKSFLASGSALGAAIVINEGNFSKKLFVEKLKVEEIEFK